MGSVVKKSTILLEVLFIQRIHQLKMISLILLSLASLSAGQYFYKPSRSSYVSYTSPVTSYYNRYSPRVVLPSTYGVVATPTIVRNVITEANSPSAKAALSYLSEGAGLDSCGEQTKAYVKVVLSGGSRQEATAVAQRVYQQNYGRAALSPACVAAEQAWKSAVAAGRDPVLDAALAFMNASPSDSPCAVSAKDYITAVVNGAEATKASLAAAKSFAKQIVTLNQLGRSTIDPVCARAALAYASSSDKPSTPHAAAVTAFIQKALEVGSSFDPACLASTETFLQSSSNIAAARDFMRVYASNPTLASRSPCAAAAKAYAKTELASASTPTKAALFAFIDSAILSNDVGVDPVCAAAANEAAAVAYIGAVEANPQFNQNSPCGQAA